MTLKDAGKRAADDRRPEVAWPADGASGSRRGAGPLAGLDGWRACTRELLQGLV